MISPYSVILSTRSTVISSPYSSVDISSILSLRIMQPGTTDSSPFSDITGSTACHLYLFGYFDLWGSEVKAPIRFLTVGGINAISSW